MSKRPRHDGDTSADIEARLRAELLRLAPLRAVRGATFCPSEVARAVAPAHWRPLMPAVRAVAAGLIADGALEATQRGVPLTCSVVAARGPIRLRAPR
jgi:hypothetical protein